MYTPLSRTKLESTQWAHLKHGLGDGRDVPDTLLALESRDEDALDYLYVSIYHQGTVYPATVPAVAYLVQLTVCPTADRWGILLFLNHLSKGAGREEGVEEAVHDAVAEGIGQYLQILMDKDSELRAAAALLIGSCVTRQDVKLERALSEMLSKESDAIVRASLILVLDFFRPDEQKWLEQYLYSSAPVERIASTLKWTQRVALTDEQFAQLSSDVVEAGEAFRVVSEFLGGDTCIPTVMRMLPGWQDKVRLIQKLLLHSNADVFSSALYLAEEVAERSRESRAEIAISLCKALQNEHGNNLRDVIQTLDKIGRSAEIAANGLFILLKKDSPDQLELKPGIFTILSKFQDKRIIPYIVAELKNVAEPSLKTRMVSVFSKFQRLSDTSNEGSAEHELSKELKGTAKYLGDWAPECLEPLVHLLPVANENGRRILIETIGQYSTMPEAMQSLLSQMHEFPYSVCTALGNYGLRARQYTDLILPYLKAENIPLKYAAARAVWRCSHDSRLVYPTLQQAFSNHDEGEVRSALKLASEMRGEASKLKTPIEQIVKDWNPNKEWGFREHILGSRVPIEAAIALWRISGARDQTLPILVDFSQHVLDREIVKTLGEMGNTAVVAVPFLKQFIDSPEQACITSDELLLQECVIALEEIEGR